MAASLLKVENLKHRFGERLVLNLPSFQLERGETTVIFGPNGSGKSTLLRILALLERPSEGRSYYDGRQVSSKNSLELARNVVLLLQKPLFFAGSVAENILFGLKVRRVPKEVAQERLSRAAALFELDDLLKRRPQDLSGGELQRVNLARAFILQPKVLLLDEPFSALDAAIRNDLMAVLKRVIKETDQTTLFVTHHREEAALLAKRMVVMLNGQIVQDGSVEEIFLRPAGPEVARLMGTEAILYGRVAERLGELARVAVGDGRFIVDVGGKAGDEVTLFIRPEDVFIAKEKVQSSIRNWFEGEIVEVDFLGHLFLLTLDCGFPLKAMVTGLAREELGLEVGTSVFAGVKSSSIHAVKS
ncbi:MAG: ABC transporter ATP-binding protein [Actinomycetota bacterium]|nr:ABC transporter ATP-binding protein [Actinomycetota bacterium]